MASSTDGQRELIVGHDHVGRLAPHGILLQLNTQHFGRTECLSDEGCIVGIPLDDVDLFPAQFVDNRLDTHTAHPDAGTHRVHPGLAGGYGDLGAGARLAGNGLDLNRAVENLGHLQLQQATQHVLVTARDGDLRSTAGLADF